MSETPLYELSMAGFSEVLASKAPVPGGGGAVAAVGALAAALGSMACILTSGKKAFARQEKKIQADLKQLEGSRVALLELIEEDAEAYTRVAEAYKLDKADPERPERIEEALQIAVQPPLAMMKELAHVVEVLCKVRQHCSRMILSDVGVAAALAAGALRASLLNVHVNTAAMTNRKLARTFDLAAETCYGWVDVALELCAEVDDIICGFEEA